MTVQVVYKNKAKSSNSSVIALFADEKFQVNNTDGCLTKNETSYIKRILKNKKNSKENLIIVLVKFSFVIPLVQNINNSLLFSYLVRI